MMRTRKIIQISATVYGESPGLLTGALYALADDGTVWVTWHGEKDWRRVEDLPPLPPCGANVDRLGDHLVCGLAAGHAGRHIDKGIGEF